jgi:uncharacterized protein YjcR
VNSNRPSDKLNAHREQIDQLLASGAKKIDIAAAMDVKSSTLGSWLRNRDLGQAKTNDDVQDALRRLAESVSA